MTEAMSALTDAELAMLDLERGWFKSGGAKQALVRQRFGMSATRYAQVLNALIDRADTEAHDPMLVRRLRRVRTARRRARTA